jgi:glycosyltransferase involved in cell wall biosynthesis
VQDLYPEVAVALGALAARSAGARAMAALSRALLARSDRVVVLGEAMRERCIAAGAAPERTVVLPNWADPAEIRPVLHLENPLRRELAGEAATLVLYSGNLGRAHDLETPLAAARLLRERRDLAFLFAGDGARRGEVERAARELPGVRLAPYRPRASLSDALSAGDVHLVTLAPGLAGLVEPSKAYAAMAVGRPALYVGPEGSEVARTILAEGCGVAVANGDADGLARALAGLAADPDRRAAMGARGRRAVEERLGRAAATARFRALLEALAPAAGAGHLRPA